MATGIGRRDYAERRASRVSRLEARADRARAEGNARIAGADRIASMIPMGQPILVGHHSERRARKDAERIHSGLTRGFAKLGEAEALERRAAAAESNRAISSDNPDAVTELTAKRDRLAANVEQAKAINSAIRKAGTVAKRQGKPLAEVATPALVALGLSAGAAADALTPDCFGHLGAAPYMLTNWGSEIRRLNARIAILTARAAAPEREPETIGAVTICEEENRVQLRFPGKPGDSVRTELKRAGFRWAPSEGAWQRHASAQAWYEARRIAALA